MCQLIGPCIELFIGERLFSILPIRSTELASCGYSVVERGFNILPIRSTELASCGYSVVERGFNIDQSNIFRGSFHLLFKQAVQGLVLWIIAAGRIERDQKMSPLSGAQDFYCVNRSFWLIDSMAKQRDIVSGQALDICTRVESLVVVKCYLKLVYAIETDKSYLEILGMS